MNAEINSLQEAMFHATTDTLENMVFMEVVPLKERRTREKYFSRLEIISPVKGTLTLIASPKLAQEIAKDILNSKDESSTKEIVHDILAELLNTIAGGVMRKLTLGNETFALGIPENYMKCVFAPKEPFELLFFQIDGHTITLVAEGEEFLNYKTPQTASQ